MRSPLIALNNRLRFSMAYYGRHPDARTHRLILRYRLAYALGILREYKNSPDKKVVRQIAVKDAVLYTKLLKGFRKIHPEISDDRVKQLSFI